MEAIFGFSMATGRFALGSSEPHRVNHVDSVAANIEGHGFTTTADVKANPEIGEGSKATKLLSSTVGVKRKRGNFSEEEMLMMTNMTVLSTMWLVHLERLGLHMWILTSILK